MKVHVDDGLEEALQSLYLHEYYCRLIGELMKESLGLLESGRKEIVQDRSETSRIRKEKRLLKLLHGKSCELYDLGIDLFQAAVRAEAEIRKRLISLEVQESMNRQIKN